MRGVSPEPYAESTEIHGVLGGSYLDLHRDGRWRAQNDAGGSGAQRQRKSRVPRILEQYNSLYQSLVAVDSLASWAASTDVTPEHEGQRTGADQMLATFLGDKAVIAATRRCLKASKQLLPIEIKQLHSILLRAGGSPGTIPQVVAARVAAESHQASVQDGFSYCAVARGKDGTCAKPMIANEIDKGLQKLTDVGERAKLWNESKEIGLPLKAGLIELQRLRNQVAREMGYSSFLGCKSRITA